MCLPGRGTDPARCPGDGRDGAGRRPAAFGFRWGLVPAWRKIPRRDDGSSMPGGKVWRRSRAFGRPSAGAAVWLWPMDSMRGKAGTGRPKEPGSFPSFPAVPSDSPGCMRFGGIRAGRPWPPVPLSPPSPTPWSPHPQPHARDPRQGRRDGLARSPPGRPAVSGIAPEALSPGGDDLPGSPISEGPEGKGRRR